jgi:hypothetical protein
MSIRILEIVVYGHAGQRNSIRLNDSGLSIVTGASKTGKSSLIDIIEYCFGRETCNVSDGVIRQHVSWYGMLLDRGDTRIFIARRNPRPPKTRDPDVYLVMGHDADVAAFRDLSGNFAVDGIEKLLTTSVGIAENVTTIPEGQTRLPLKANIKHALMFCLQDQDEIDSRKVLFHRQSEPFLPQTIKDVLPYFLGAIDEDRLRRKAELDNEKKELRRLEKAAAEREQLANLSTARTDDIFREAQGAGLVPEGELPEHETALAILRGINPIIRELPVPPDSAEPIAALRRERTTLRRDLAAVREQLRQTRHVEDVAGGFAAEGDQQRARLATLGLAAEHDATTCALCGSTDIDTPAISEMRRSLEQLDQQLGQVRREVPRLQAAQAELTTRLGGIEQALKQNQAQIDGLLKQEDGFRSEQDNQIRLARTLGRITYFLETLPPPAAVMVSSDELESARKRVRALEALLDPEDTADRLSSILNIIGEFMTRDSEKLDLEHSGSRLRLDIRQLGVVADTLDGPVPLQRMGSGENWVGYHVLAHLALHRWFRQRQRPVPAFLFFDQPSQAHYPPEQDRDGDVAVLPDEDRRAVYKLFKLISDVGRELSPGFQVVIADHADLREPWFADAVVARWRGKGLVPQDWIDRAS